MHGTRDEASPARPPFEIVLRGFDRQQVIDHVNALKARVATIGAERDASQQRAADLNETVEQLRQEIAEVNRRLDRLRQEAADATAEVDRLQRSPLTAATTRIQRMLQMAEDEAAELRSRVEQETASLRESARVEADRLLAEVTQRCERMEAESLSRCQTTDAESVTRRKQAENQSEQDIARRHAETESWTRDYQTRSIAALHLILQMAGERLSLRVAKVQRQVTAAKQLRTEVTGQLSEVHRMLVEALGVVDQPTAAEHAEAAEYAQAAEQTTVAEQTRVAESAEPPDGSPLPEPAADAAGPNGTRAFRRREQPGPAGRPRKADPPPTIRFGLHP